MLGRYRFERILECFRASRRYSNLQHADIIRWYVRCRDFACDMQIDLSVAYKRLLGNEELCAGMQNKTISPATELGVMPH